MEPLGRDELAGAEVFENGLDAWRCIPVEPCDFNTNFEFEFYSVITLPGPYMSTLCETL